MNFTQSFIELRRKCVSSRKLFEDPEFQPEKISMIKKLHETIQWKRPKEICSKPQFDVDGFSRFDVKQGSLGNCWFLASIETLTQNRQLFHKVVPNDCSFEKGYFGIFRFRFWRYGKWVEVVIDDRLPTVKGKLIYLQAPQSEFWPALLEKAYAKFYGSYSAIHGGNSTEALVDFSGGVIERIKIASSPPYLFLLLSKTKELGSFITTSIFEESEEKRLKGLVGGHAYSVTNVEEITLKTKKKVQLLLIRNPWGNHVEWNGAFSDKSNDWNLVSPEDHKRLQREISDNGEFFITFDDFTRFFDRIELCHLCPDALSLQDCKQSWKKSIFEGNWIEGQVNSPQIIVKLEQPDEGAKDKLSTIIVALMQKHQRNLIEKQKYIKFDVFKASADDANQNFLGKQFFTKDKIVGRHPFEPYREIVSRFKLPQGYYVIIPSIESAGEFMIRVFTESHSNPNNPIIKVNSLNQAPTFMKKSVSILDICDDHNHEPPKVPVQVKQQDFIEQRRTSGSRSPTAKKFMFLGTFLMLCILLLIFIIAFILLDQSQD